MYAPPAFTYQSARPQTYPNRPVSVASQSESNEHVVFFSGWAEISVSGVHALAPFKLVPSSVPSIPTTHCGLT